jgi:type I restriction enzyme, S subunit
VSWPLVNLGSIAEKIDYGLTASANFELDEPKFLRITDLQDGSVDWLSVPSCKCSEKEVDQYRLEDGDIVFARTGATTGKSYLLRNLAAQAVFASYLIRLRPKKSVDSSYLAHFFQSPNYWSQIQIMANGAAQPGVNASKLKELSVPLPPLEEQKRIAAILDKADAIRRKRQQAIKLADDFLRSVFLEMFGDPVTNPKGWEVKYLKDISRIQIGPFGTQLHKEDYVSDGVPLINPTHISGGKLLPNNDLTVSPQKHAELPEYHLRFGDIIMGRRGEMGRCAVIEKEHVGWLCGTGSLFIRPHNPGVLSEYLFAYLSSDYMKGYLESESLGATMPNLNKGIVGDIKVPLPPQSVMEKYAKIRDQLVCAKQNNTAFSKYNFFESLSQKAFLGEL